MKEQLNSRDLILLSAYLDGELDPREKARVEALLQSNPEAKQTYESLQRTRAVLRSAPLRKVPRNFTLTAAAVQPRRPFILIPALRFSSVLATLIAVWMFVSQLLPGMATRPLMASEPAMESQAVTGTETMRIMAAPESAQETAQEPPPVVYWGGPPSPPAMGMGGAGTAPGCADAFCGGAVDTLYPEGMGGSGEPAFKNQGMPQSETGNIQINPVPTQIEPLPLEGSGPILGVRRAEEQGKTLYTPDQSQPLNLPALTPPQPQSETEGGLIRPSSLMAAGFAILAIGLWLLSILFKRKVG
ncbi:MAG: anti-sigma factor family protein [Bellilinea sp.]